MQASYRQKCKFMPEAVCCCLQICNFGFPTPSLQSLVRAAGRPDWESIQDIDVPPFQHSLSRAIHEASFDALLASATHPRSKALALSTAIRHAGDWLNVVPSSTLGLHLQDREFRLCLQYWPLCCRPFWGSSCGLWGKCR